MNRRGVTLIELLMTIIIGSIAMLPLAIPFSAERIFWNKGKQQTESQRDAQMGMRAIARVAHGAQSYSRSSGHLLFQLPGPIFRCFDGGPAFSNQLVLTNCGDPPSPLAVLIDGNRSQVDSFVVTQVVPNKLVRVKLQVSHRLRTTDPRQEDEILETELFLRNGT